MSGTLTHVEDDAISDFTSPALTNDRDTVPPRQSNVQYDEQLDAEFALGSSLVGGTERELSFQAAIARIREFSRLPANWDTYGGNGGTQQPVDYSVNLLHLIRGLPEVTSPKVCPIDSGVYLEWRNGNSSLYFEVDEDSVLYVMRHGNHVVVRGEDQFYDVFQAERLVSRLFQLSIRR